MQTTLRFHERNGQTYIMQYSANEMAELFTDEQRKFFEDGECVLRNGTKIVDLEAFFLKNNGFGVDQ